MLYPRESETREVKDLSGIWKFKIDKGNEGYAKKWYAEPLSDTILMPVPASYNDITQDAAIRDHIGDAWYEKMFFVPVSWQDKRIILRIGSATHHATVWVNGEKTVEHKGGYLPFEADVTTIVKAGEENRVTVAVSNVLDWTTLPPGQIRKLEDDMHPEGYQIQDYFHDFFNYSGIHRPVRLYSTPGTYIDDVTVTTDIDGTDGIVFYDVTTAGGNPAVRVRFLDENGKEVAKKDGTSGELVVKKARLWEPGDGYLYTLLIETITGHGTVEDRYRLPIGIRTVRVTEKEFLINGKPFYFKGFGKHEDMDIRGKGLDRAVIVKDFNLLKWIGANSFRTSHYPYSEELMNLADREGFAIIDESPAVGMNSFSPRNPYFCEERIHDATLENHIQVMEELIKRDKNHPCVVMWSVANEAATFEEGAEPYFKKVAEVTRKLDPSRPITIVNSSRPDQCRVAQFFDVVCLNRYYSWYFDPGHLELIEYQLEQELKAWHDLIGKPVMLTEYGADTIDGFHQDPPVMFSEEYQCEFLDQYHKVFDELDFFIGEHVWNFADFATKQGITRIIGNRKGVFTRQRQPKAAAHILRKRWLNK